MTEKCAEIQERESDSELQTQAKKRGSDEAERHESKEDAIADEEGHYLLKNLPLRE